MQTLDYLGLGRNEIDGFSIMQKLDYLGLGGNEIDGFSIMQTLDYLGLGGKEAAVRLPSHGLCGEDFRAR